MFVLETVEFSEAIKLRTFNFSGRNLRFDQVFFCKFVNEPHDGRYVSNHISDKIHTPLPVNFSQNKSSNYCFVDRIYSPSVIQIPAIVPPLLQ